ncbi:hypothetical protein BST25_15820 [Mycobacterium heidelbergense]|uniref:Uncharacterized protein n=2 Tax=Mycobacterium heidelbergense TaxID=53376 RepID=A0A1X0DHQ6_MYCHE|nr:hypothetical protein [Mycobacterium heidelbergense]ORA71905.1 hypothetical protein BST25_15820 [Mycobacterium heidelbergense]
MADRLDVAERLAEGRPAVEHTQSYVWACHALGYRHPDLTSRPSQIRDWYDSEDGLDLRALDRDCAELRAAGEAVSEALRAQRAQLAELAAAWRGPGGDSAVGFLQRHCDAANAVATEVRAAAQRCESLRDNLWYLVDSKVATAIAIDDRTRAQRPTWLAASDAVTTGVGDRPGAEEVIRQQVIPHVDNEIRDDWLTTMRSTVDGVATAYDMVIDRMAAAPSACFEFPGDLSPGYQPLPPAPTGAPAPAAPVTPAAFPGPPADPAPAPAVTPAAPTLPATPLPDLGTALGAGDPSGDIGGLGGLASRIVDAMGSLLGSAAEDPFDGDPFHSDDEHHVVDDGPDEPEEVDKTEEAKPAEGARPVDAAPPADGPPAPVDAPPAPPAPAEAPASPAPVAAPSTGGPAPAADEGSTPCEIAADQLPQAGG